MVVLTSPVGLIIKPMSPYTEVASLLIDIEAQLRQLGLWQSESPTAVELASTEPFCIDTLTFPQWLQFVFLSRIQSLVELRQQLPEKCQVAPMAEEYFKQANAAALVAVIAQLDQLLSN